MQLTRLAIAVGAAFALATPAFAAGDMHRDRSAQGMHSEMHASSTVRDAQQALQDKGHDVGPIDGVFGPKTSAALRDFQSAQGLKVTGQLDRETMSALNVRSTGMSGGTSPSRTSGSSSGPTVSSDAKSPSPASTESGKTSPSASGTAPATSSPPASTSRSTPGGMGGPASSGMSGSASTDSTSPSPSSTQSGKAGGG
jgi:peptidoglycan hydrolase-like protein with peptidoglycan-binding domain